MKKPRVRIIFTKSPKAPKAPDMALYNENPEPYTLGGFYITILRIIILYP